MTTNRSFDFDLIFERFLNPERVSLPDIDIDFCERRRGEVIEYVTRKYGRENVAQIITFGTMKDKAVVRPLAERLRQDGLKVWFDEWVLQPGDSIPAKIEEGLEHSRVLVLCMSAQAFGSDWAQLEAQGHRFTRADLSSI